MRLVVRSMLALAALGSLSCAQPPTKELEMTAERVRRASEGHAELFAAEELAAAEASLAEARRLIDEEEYAAAIRALSFSSLRADAALARARAERVVVERRLRQLFFELESLLEMASSRGAGVEAAAELDSLRARYESVRRLEAEGELLAALNEGALLKPELLALEERFRSRLSERR